LEGVTACLRHAPELVERCRSEEGAGTRLGTHVQWLATPVLEAWIAKQGMEGVVPLPPPRDRRRARGKGKGDPQRKRQEEVFSEAMTKRMTSTQQEALDKWWLGHAKGDDVEAQVKSSQLDREGLEKLAKKVGRTPDQVTNWLRERRKQHRKKAMAMPVD
jgi:hypothetical protein